jgi:uncharacterized protein YsxB (DUF464 family)
VLEVTFFEDSRKRLSSLVAEGHAGWAEHGNDVVCAAVSALLQGAWLGLTAHANVAVRAARTEGRLSLSWPPAESDRAEVRAIVETAALAVGQIAAQYPAHVRVVRETSDILSEEVQEK